MTKTFKDLAVDAKFTFLYTSTTLVWTKIDHRRARTTTLTTKAEVTVRVAPKEEVTECDS